MAPRPAPRDHPIFGDGGIMRGILYPHYSLNPAYQKVGWKKFGANGLTVGQCWAKQAATVRDGAHGTHMGGITGTDETGAYSIIVGKGDNIDEGDIIYYLPPNSAKNSKVNATMDSVGALTLARSIFTQRPVRVIRAANGTSPQYRPKSGFRYDGLYQVMTVEENGTKEGGSYVQFKLVRMANQLPVNANLPTDAEVALFNQVRNGY